MKVFFEVVKNKIGFLTKDSRKLGTRFLISAAVHFFAVFNLIFYTSIEVFLGNIEDFGFAFSSLLLVMGLASLVIFLVFSGISLILKGRLFNYYISVVFAFSVCGYLQGNFMNNSLPVLDGNQIQWHLMTKWSLVNLIIWIVFFSIPFIVHFFDKKLWKSLVLFISCAGIIMSGSSFGFLTATTNFEQRTSEGFYSREDIYEVSNDGDIIVFVLDFFDNKYMDELLKEDTEILSEWTGFTRFSNCTGMYKQTRPSIDYLLTAEKWLFEESLLDFPAKAFASSDFLERVQQKGYNIDLYVSGAADTNAAYDISNNYNFFNPKIKPLGMFNSMLNYSLYKNMPMITKSVFWHYTDDITNASIQTSDLPLDQIAYTIDDTLFYSDFKKEGISEGKEKSFKFIHMMGAHYPYTMDENGNYTTETTAQQQQKGSIKIVSDYIKEMKKNKVYDNSTIIIMADHGVVEVSDEMHRSSNPIFFIKPSKADSNMKVVDSLAPVSQDDFHSTVLFAAGDENYSDFGRTVFEIKENEKRIRNFLYLASQDGKSDNILLEYEINGEADDFHNWKLTGNSWTPQYK